MVIGRLTDALSAGPPFVLGSEDGTVQGSVFEFGKGPGMTVYVGIDGHVHEVAGGGGR